MKTWPMAYAFRASTKRVLDEIVEWSLRSAALWDEVRIASMKAHWGFRVVSNKDWSLREPWP